MVAACVLAEKTKVAREYTRLSYCTYLVRPITYVLCKLARTRGGGEASPGKLYGARSTSLSSEAHDTHNFLSKCSQTEGI